MGQKLSFYLYVVAFSLVVLVTAYMIVDRNGYEAVNPLLLLCMYGGIAVVSFGMRDEMLQMFEK